MSRRPLDGVRILDFTHVLAGTFATRVLGDMGADVVKVNSADRAVAVNDVGSPFYVMWNRNKRALSLDMKHPQARELCLRLVEQADAVIDNFAVGVLDRWGVGYAAGSARNPRVTYVQMSGMGERGPWSGFVTFAPTIHALCGITHLTGVPGREDIGAGTSYNDHQAGLHGAFAILAALEARDRTGRGQHVDLSQFEVGVNFLGPALLDHAGNGRAARPTGNVPPYDVFAPHDVYPCRPKGEGIAGERWLAIACLTDAQWRALRDAMGSPAWARDAAFDTADGRAAARARIDAGVAAWTRVRDAFETMTLLQAAGVPAGVVQDGVDLNEHDPQLRHAGFLTPVDDPDPQLGAMWVDRLPLHFEKTPCEVYRRVRRVGEDNASVLHDWLGMSVEDVRAREADGPLR
jgi:crotonobetainyl-CoA:carnitine CoA-transferase CaiB-like acyl-CoA transferase